MNNEKRLFNLLLDSELLLADMGAPATRIIKTPSNLRKLLHERTAKERLDVSNIPNNALALNVSALQKSAEAVKSSLASELAANETNLADFSYGDMTAYPVDPFAAAEKYLAACRARSVAGITMAIQHRPINSLKREIIAEGISWWDTRIENVIESTQNAPEIPGVKETILGERPLVFEGKSKQLDAKKITYLQSVQKYVHDSHWRERKLAETTQGDTLNVSDVDMRSRNGDLLTSRKKGLDALFDELSSANYTSDCAFLFGLAKELLAEGSAVQVTLMERIQEQRLDEPARRAALSDRLVDQLVDNSLRVLEGLQLEAVRKRAFRAKLGSNPPVLSPASQEALEVLYYYFESIMLSREDADEFNYARDSTGLALWALCWVGLRAGQLRAVNDLLENYIGSFKTEAQALQACLRAAVEKGAERVDFLVNPGDDDFKRALSLAVGEGEGLPANFLVNDLSDYIWFTLFQTRAHLTLGHPGLPLPKLQKKIMSELAQVTSALELVKLQMLCLMFEDAVGTLARSQLHLGEAAQLGFLYLNSDVPEAMSLFRRKHTAYSPRTTQKDVEEVIMGFARDLSERYPVEVLAYFDRFPLERNEQIADFMEKNGLVSQLFGTSPDARTRASRARLLLGARWNAVLSHLSARKPLGDPSRDLPKLRILEEQNNVGEIAELMAARELRAIAAAKRGEAEPIAARDYNAYLDRLFEKYFQDAGGLASTAVNDVFFLRRIRTLEITFTIQRKLKESFTFLENNMQLFDMSMAGKRYGLRCAFYELMRLALLVLSEYRDHVKSSHFRFNADAQLESIQRKLKAIKDKFFETTQLPPAADLDAPPELVRPEEVLHALINKISLAE